MKRVFLFLTVFIIFTSSCLWAEEISLTLEEAIFIGLRDNREVLIKAEEVKKAKEKIAEARAGFLPELDFTGARTYTRGYYEKDLGETDMRISLKQYLYNGWKTGNEISQNKYGHEAAGARLDRAKAETILNIKEAFYTFLLSEEFSALNKMILDNTMEHLNVIQARYEKGEASESDILRIKESLFGVQEAYESSLNQVESSQSLLRNLLYLNDGIIIKADGQLSYEERQFAYDEAFLKALANRPEIREYAAMEMADKKTIEIAKAGNRPSVYASWDYYSRSHAVTTTVNTKDWHDYNIIGVTLTWPIFDGWATRAKVEQAIIGLKETQLAKEKVVKDIALELKNAYLGLKNAIARIRTVDSELGVYSDNLSGVAEKYRQGIASLLDNEDAALKYEISSFNKKQAIYDYIIAQSSFDKATGGT